MMGFWSSTWGDIATVIGIFVALGGLAWAIKEARGARSASESAAEAASDTSAQIARHLQTVDLQRAIGLIQRIKTLHDNDRWEASRELYQSLREMLSDIIARCPDEQADLRKKLVAARTTLSKTEESVRRSVSSTQAVSGNTRSQFNKRLNGIQSDLEELASSVELGDSQGETR